MAREALKALSRKSMSVSEVIGFFGALETESDRAVAILACTTIEEALEEAIRSRMVLLSNRDIDHLFRGDNPLSTFSAKTKVGFAVGLYGHATRADLDCVRDIRNAFAHTKIPINFDTPEVADACTTLAAFTSGRGKLEGPWPPRRRYLIAANALVVNLTEIAEAGLDAQRPLPVLP